MAFGYRVLLLENWNRGPGGFDLHVQQMDSGRTLVAKPVEMVFAEKETSFGILGEPFLTFHGGGKESSDESSPLLQAFERAFSPSDSLDQKASLAMKRHLEDMRALVFKGGMPK